MGPLRLGPQRPFCPSPPAMSILQVGTLRHGGRGETAQSCPNSAAQAESAALRPWSSREGQLACPLPGPGWGPCEAEHCTSAGHCCGSRQERTHLLPPLEKWCLSWVQNQDYNPISISLSCDFVFFSLPQEERLGTHASQCHTVWELKSNQKHPALPWVQRLPRPRALGPLGQAQVPMPWQP